MKDKDRRKELLIIISDAKKEIKVFNKQHKKYVKQSKKLSAERITDIEEIKALWDKAFSDRKNFQQSLIDKRLTSQGLTTDEEWNAILHKGVNPKEKKEKKSEKQDLKLEEAKEKVFGKIKALIEKEVIDPGRKELIVAAYEDFEKHLFELLEAFADADFQGSVDITKRSTTRQELEIFYKHQNDIRKELYPAYFNMIEVMQKETTDDEWKAIIKKLEDLY